MESVASLGAGGEPLCGWLDAGLIPALPQKQRQGQGKGKGKGKANNRQKQQRRRVLRGRDGIHPTLRDETAKDGAPGRAESPALSRKQGQTPSRNKRHEGICRKRD